MIQTYNFDISIPLLPSPATNLPRALVNPIVVINTFAKVINITWHIETTDLLGEKTYETDTQIADNNGLVNLSTQEILTVDQYNALVNKPEVMGEGASRLAQPRVGFAHTGV